MNCYIVCLFNKFRKTDQFNANLSRMGLRNIGIASYYLHPERLCSFCNFTSDSTQADYTQGLFENFGS